MFCHILAEKRFTGSFNKNIHTYILMQVGREVGMHHIMCVNLFNLRRTALHMETCL